MTTFINKNGIMLTNTKSLDEIINSETKDLINWNNVAVVLQNNYKLYEDDYCVVVTIHKPTAVKD